MVNDLDERDLLVKYYPGGFVDRQLVDGVGKCDRVIKLLIEGGAKGSRIESIKLLFMLAKCNGEDAKWTVENARQHANEMLKVLKTFLC